MPGDTVGLFMQSFVPAARDGASGFRADNIKAREDYQVKKRMRTTTTTTTTTTSSRTLDITSHACFHNV